jgi:hypothetical protein
MSNAKELLLVGFYRRMADGREIIIIDNRYSGPPDPFGYFVDLPPPVRPTYASPSITLPASYSPGCCCLNALSMASLIATMRTRLYAALRKVV